MAMVSKTHKFIYVSGGRNATGAIKGALVTIPKLSAYEPAKINKGDWKKYNKHMPARHIKKAIPAQEWNNFFKFSFVRNTYSWVVSSFFFWVKCGIRNMPTNGLMTIDDFNYVVEYYSSPAGRRHDECSPIRSQHSFLSNKKGKIMVDFVGHFESLQTDFNHICQKINVSPIQLPIKNSSAASINKPHSIGIHWTEHYKRNPGAKELITHYWKRDIEAFNFTLDI